MLSRLVTAVVVTCVLLLSARSAHAQIPNQLYDDVKSVIEDLMIDEVAQTVVPNAACQQPVLVVYFPNTLQRVYDRQFGALKATIQSDAAATVGSFLYWLAEYGGPTPRIRDFLTAEKPPQLHIDPAKPRECGNSIRTEGGPGHYARAKLRAPLLTRECVSMASAYNGSPAIKKKAVACEIGLAAQAFLLDQPDVGETHIKRLVSILLASSLGLNKPDQVEELNVLLAAYIADPNLAKVPSVNDPTLADLLTKTLPATLQFIGREWHLLTATGSRKLTVTDVIDILLSTAIPVLNDACNNIPACATMVDKLAKSGEAREFLRAAASHDLRTAAVDLLRGAFSIVESKPDCSSGTIATSQLPADSVKTTLTAAARPSCEEQVVISRYGVFFAALATYVIESEKGQAADATRTAFRSAAFDLLRVDGTKTGFDRPPFSAPKFGGFLIPRPSLRVSWNGGYYNANTHDGVRYTASVDWLTARIPVMYTQSTYAAVYVSIVDFLAPFSESALRDQTGQVTHGGVVWDNLVTPRIDVLFGFPSLSTHLALTGGVSFRTAAAFRDPGTTNNYSYYSWASGIPSQYSDRPYAFYSQFFETNIGVTYIP
jgi:hypothetical protein